MDEFEQECGIPSAYTAQRGRSIVYGALLFMFALVWLWTVLINDEWGDMYYHIRQGERFAAGELPYRDFHLVTWPGFPFLLGLWFKLVGCSMASIHAIQALAGAVSVLLAWLIAQRVVKSHLQWIAPAGALCSYVIGNEGIGHMAFAITFALGGILCAVIADEKGRKSFWFAAGALAALAGTCTQTVGIFLGFGLVMAALLGARGERVRSATMTILGAIPVLAIMFGSMAFAGILPEFYTDTFVQTRERYTPFVAGVGWGGWLPPWGLLKTLPGRWWPTWVPAFAVWWAGAYVYPFIIAYSAVRGCLKRDESRVRRLLCISCLAVLGSAYPVGAAMRIARLTVPIWILIAFELEQLLSQSRASSPSWTRLTNAVAIIACCALLLTTPLQFAYRYQMVELRTRLGTATVYPASRDEYNILEREFKPGDEVFVLPELGASAVLYELKNPTSYNALTPVIYTPRQMQQAADELEAKGRPPVVFMTMREGSKIEDIQRKFGPSEYTNEFLKNPMSDYLSANYEVVLREGPVVVFRAKKSPGP